MSVHLNKEAYEKLIEEDIKAMNSYMPDTSLERKHIEEVLKYSVGMIYGHGGIMPNTPNLKQFLGYYFDIDTLKCAHPEPTNGAYAIVEIEIEDKKHQDMTDATIVKEPRYHRWDGELNDYVPIDS